MFRDSLLSNCIFRYSPFPICSGKGETVSKLFADQSRLKILYALRNGEELCVCDIATMLGVKVATASHQLRKLRDLKILKYRNQGKLVYYSLRDQRVIDILKFALGQIII